MTGEKGMLGPIDNADDKGGRVESVINKPPQSIPSKERELRCYHLMYVDGGLYGGISAFVEAEDPQKAAEKIGGVLEARQQRRGSWFGSTPMQISGLVMKRVIQIGFHDGSTKRASDEAELRAYNDSKLPRNQRLRPKFSCEKELKNIDDLREVLREEKLLLE